MREVKKWEGGATTTTTIVDDGCESGRVGKRYAEYNIETTTERGGAATARTVYIISPAPARLFDTASSPKMRAPRFRCGCGEHDDDGGGGGREDDERGGLCGGGGARSTRLRDGERRSSAPSMSM